MSPPLVARASSLASLRSAARPLWRAAGRRLRGPRRRDSAMWIALPADALPLADAAPAVCGAQRARPGRRDRGVPGADAGRAVRDVVRPTGSRTRQYLSHLRRPTRFPGRAPDHFARVFRRRSRRPSASTIRRPGPITRLMDSERPIANGALLGSEHMDYVDANFFDVLDLPLVAGDKRTALADPDDVVITRGHGQEVLRHDGGARPAFDALLPRQAPAFTGSPASCKDIPANSHLKISVVAPLTPAMESDPDQRHGPVERPALLHLRALHEVPPTPARSRPICRRFVLRRAHDSGPGSTPGINRMMRLGLTPLRDLHFADARLLGPMKARRGRPPGLRAGHWSGR